MAKAKKTTISKKNKSEEQDVDNVVDDNTDPKVVIESEETQENGEVDANIKKKGKASKKGESSSENEEKEEESSQENGEDVDSKDDKKKTPAKKAKAVKKTPSKPTSEPARKSSRTPKPVKSEDEDFEVEKIVDFRVHRGTTQYLVRWKGYSRGDDTWEDEANLNCTDLLQKFKEENKGKSPTKRSASKTPTKSSPKKAKKEEKDYEVEEIVGMRIKNGKKEFKIRWKGYKASDDSWEPEKHLSCQDLIDKYLEEHKDEAEHEEQKTTKKEKPAPKTATTKSGRKTRAK